MYIRPKTKRRLLILGGVALIVGTSVWALVFYRGKNLARQAAANRANGMALYHAGDYAGALKSLSDYVAKSGTAVPGNPSPDLEALFAYGRSRQLVPIAGPNNDHLRESTRTYELYLTFKRDDVDVLHTLLGVYNAIKYEREAMRVADDLLAVRPDDVEALWVKSQVLLRQQPKPARAEALKAIDRLTEVAPNDMRAHREAQKVRLQMGTTPDALIARADELRRRNDGNPRFELLLGITYLALENAQGLTPDQAKRAEWGQRGETWLQTAANRNPPDAEYVRFMTTTLDGQGFFPQSLAVLLNAVDKAKIDDKDIARRLVQRLWEAGALRAVVDRTEAIDLADAKSDPRVLGYRALALYQMDQIERGPAATQPSTRPVDGGRRARADAIVAALAGRANDATASAWATVLRGRFPAGGAAPLPLRDQLRQFETGLRLAPDLAIAHFMTGETYDILGEAEGARRAYEQAAQRSPSWALPHAILARTLTREGREEPAFARAFEAYRRAPHLPAIQAVYAITRYNALNKAKPGTPAAPKPGDFEELLGLVQKIQDANPGDAETLPLYVTLLSKTGKRDAAIERAKAALSANPPLPAEALLRLDAVNESEKLGLGETLLDQAGEAGGALAVARLRAQDLAAAGNAAGGLTLLQEAQRQAKAQEDPRWQLAILQYRQFAGEPPAALVKAWVELADANPNQAGIQAAALRAPARELDRAFWRRVIDRVSAATGEQGQLWRIENCRWLLSSDVPKDRAEAMAKLAELARQYPDQWEVRATLGLALARDGKFPRAVEELTAAVKARPADVRLNLELIRVLNLAGNVVDGRGRLDQLAQRPLDPEARRKVASLFEDDGRMEKAIEVLAMAGPSTRPAVGGGAAVDASDPAINGMLARLFRRAGRTDDAAAMYRDLTADPDALVPDLAAGAEFFASVGKMDDARLVLDRLNRMRLRPGPWQIILGNFHERFASTEEALKYFTAATTAEPTAPETWRELAGFHLRGLRLTEAQSAIDKGLAAAPGNADLAAFGQHVALLKASPRPKELQPLLNLLTREPANSAAGEMFKLLAEAQATGADVKPEAQPALTERFRELADRRPEFLPAQEYLVRQYLVAGQFEKAAGVAERAVQRFPHEEEPARLATMAYAAQADAGNRNWDKMLAAATQWKQRTRGNTLPADVAMAEAMMGQGRPQIAVQQLEPHVKAMNAATRPATASTTAPATQVTSSDAPRLRLHLVYARALIASDRSADAAAALSPLLPTGTEARQVWLSLAGRLKEAAAATAWVERAVPFLNLSDAAERYALADAWHEVGQAFGSTAVHEKARDALKPLSDRPDASPAVLQLSAYVAQDVGDLATAEAGWRKLLAAGFDSDPAILNNLAYVLLLNGKPDALPDALKHSEAAVAAAPGNAGFLDTLARIHAASGRADQAVKSFRAALAKEPESLEAMIGLADQLRASSRPEDQAEAKTLVGRIDTAMKRAAPLPPLLRKQWESVRTAVVPVESVP